MLTTETVRATAEKPIAALRHNRGDANKVETLESEQVSTTAGVQQHQNPNNSVEC
jgi:hypothetical protein